MHYIIFYQAESTYRTRYMGVIDRRFSRAVIPMVIDRGAFDQAQRASQSRNCDVWRLCLAAQRYASIAPLATLIDRDE
jgi:hypothetical protein